GIARARVGSEPAEANRDQVSLPPVVRADPSIYRANRARAPGPLHRHTDPGNGRAPLASLLPAQSARRRVEGAAAGERQPAHKRHLDVERLGQPPPSPASPSHTIDSIMNKPLVVLLSIATALRAQVPFDPTLHADREPQNWLTYSGTMQSQRHSSLSQITTGN